MRYRSLDALRGIAALGVVIYHCYMTLTPQGQHQFEAFVSGTPLAVLLIGRPFVILFFVLSGFALASALLSETGFYVRGYIIKRILRIYLPYVAAVALSVLIYLLVQPRTIYVLSGWFNSTWGPGIPAHVVLGHLLMTGVPAASTLDNVNWSLVFELRISLIFPIIVLSILRLGAIQTGVIAILVSGVADVILKLSNVSLIPFYAGTPFLAIITTAHFVVLFALGAILASWIRQRRSDPGPGWPVQFALLLLGFYSLVRGGQTLDTVGITAVTGAGLLFAAAWCRPLMHLLEREVPGYLQGLRTWRYLRLFWWIAQAAILAVGYKLLAPGEHMISDALSGIGAAIIIFVAVSSPWLGRLLELRLPLFLGRISYSLYLVHLPILIGFTHLLFGRLNQVWVEATALLVIFPVATLMNRFVEIPSQRLGRILARENTPSRVRGQDGVGQEKPQIVPHIP